MALKIDQDHGRFRHIVRGRIRENLRKYISKGELIGRKGNRDALGARLNLESGGRSQVREVGPSGSYLSSNDVRAHFGLGESNGVEIVRIRWPTGAVEELYDVAIDRYHTIVEPR